jgi:hypothetical protein
LLHGPFGLLEVEPYPESVDAASRDASLRDLSLLVWAFKSGHPEARRAVLSIHERLWGTQRGASSLRGDAIGDELLFAGRAGLVVVRRRETRAVVVASDGPSEPLGPVSSASSAPPSKSWLGLVLVDQDGAPVPGRAYRVARPDGSTVDGTLDSHGAVMLRDLDPGSCEIWCPYVEPHPATTYTVAPGDHVSGIGQRFGFDDYTTVWNDPGNAELQQLRPDPHVLQPGDTLAIPEVKAQPATSKPTGAKHQFQLKRSPLRIRLKLLDLAVKPVPSAQVTLAGDALTTDGDGLVEATVDKSATDVPLDTTFAPEAHLAVGDLNPSDDATDAGYKARLYNLGFLWNPTVDDADDEMLIALEDFQAQYALDLTKQLDDATKAQIVQAHGC